MSRGSWQTFGPLMPTEHHLNATPFSATDQERPFMATVYPFSKGLPAGDNGLCYKALIISRTFQKKRQWLPSTPLAFTNPQSSTQQSTFEVSCNGRFATWMHCQNQNSRENNLWIHACKVHFFLKKPLWEQSNSSAMLRDDYIVIFIVLQVCFVWWELSWEEKKRKV